jgi:hypothetical protein
MLHFGSSATNQSRLRPGEGEKREPSENVHLAFPVTDDATVGELEPNAHRRSIRLIGGARPDADRFHE